ncbi:MAG: hypothetical protein K8H88_15510 [Sandaracinaceae bacterium]|nr:hypothetical protein [Sandaracinaceae bacterium]
MIAATDQDLVIGLCIHYELVPTPSPTPTPIPHPFVATISDPSRKAAQAITAPMQAAGGELPDDRPLAIYGLPTTAVGTITKNATSLPHVPLPPGTGWAPMPKPPKPKVGILVAPPPPDLPVCPAGDALMDKGSSQCNFGAGAIVRLGDPAKSCSEPARQVSTVLAIPKGPPVLVMG